MKVLGTHASSIQLSIQSAVDPKRKSRNAAPPISTSLLRFYSDHVTFGRPLRSCTASYDQWIQIRLNPSTVSTRQKGNLVPNQSTNPRRPNAPSSAIAEQIRPLTRAIRLLLRAHHEHSNCGSTHDDQRCQCREARAGYLCDDASRTVVWWCQWPRKWVYGCSVD